MKTKNIGILLTWFFILPTLSCADLDIQPLSEASMDNWYKDPIEYNLAANNLIAEAFYPLDGLGWDDDMVGRNGIDPFANGTLNADNGTVSSRYLNHYKLITRATHLLGQLQYAPERGVSAGDVTRMRGECLFAIGFSYAMLATYWGDVVLYKNDITLEEGYSAHRSPKADVLQYAFECLDEAATLLPDHYSGGQRPSAAAALGFKARFALFHKDYEAAADAARKVIGMDVFQLHPTYADLFTANSSKEHIWFFKGSYALNHSVGYFKDIYNYISRKSGGTSSLIPRYDLLCAYTCVDGKPIDKSPYYNPKDPFVNRDPRLTATIQPFKTKYSSDIDRYNASKADGTFADKYGQYLLLGYEYSPNPYATQLYNASTKNMDFNSDSKAVSEYASYTGLLMRKYLRNDWSNWGSTGGTGENIQPYLRYAEILLTLCEAEIEMGTVTQDILDMTINAVRRRAYASSQWRCPEVKLASQSELRREIRVERRMEFAFEGLRYRDLLRWGLAEKVLNMPAYYQGRAWSSSQSWNGLTGEESNALLSDDFKRLLNNWDEGNFPIGGVPEIDEDGVANLAPMAEKGYIQVLSVPTFDPKKNYLWPIPASDLLVNKNMTQNYGY